MEALKLVDKLLRYIDDQCPIKTCPATAGQCPFAKKTSPLCRATFEALTADVEGLIQSKGCAPILVRLAWHDAGTYSQKDNTGGPRAAQRFATGESTYAANAGLDIARGLLADIQAKYCNGVNGVDENNIAIADLWAFAGNTAIRVCGGPDVPFMFGRRDIRSPAECVEDGRLPDGDKGLNHLRCVFNRIGFNDREIVALSGAHTLGRCHGDRSGFAGPWTAEPLRFDNVYFQDLINKKWVDDQSAAGNPQLKNANDESDDTMMLISDYCLYQRPETKAIVEEYAKDEKAFFRDFSLAWIKLIQGGYEKSLYSVQ
jgi:catalase (peroxidase I)